MTGRRFPVPAMLFVGAMLGIATTSCSDRIEHARAIDGDTFEASGIRYRLAGIDAPEFPGHCRVGRVCVAGDPRTSQLTLQSFLDEGVSCTHHGQDYYHRTLVICTTREGNDLGGMLVSFGMAEPYEPAGR